MPEIPKKLLTELDQVAKFGLLDGPRLIFEAGRQVIYSGNPPWPLNRQQKNPAQPIQPFTLIANFHARNKNNIIGRIDPNAKPIVTSEDAANPQLPQALGVDFVTLVAQVLHDPAVLPPEPRTDNGPATRVNAERAG